MQSLGESFCEPLSPFRFRFSGILRASYATERSAGSSGDRGSIHYLLDPFSRPVDDGRPHVCRVCGTSTLCHILLGRRNYRSRTEFRLFRSAHRRFARSPELSWPPCHKSISVTPRGQTSKRIGGFQPVSGCLFLPKGLSVRRGIQAVLFRGQDTWLGPPLASIKRMIN